MHPCKDTAGKSLWNFEEPLYTLMVENVRMPGMAKPQSVNLLELLEVVFRDCEEDEKQDAKPDSSADGAVADSDGIPHCGEDKEMGAAKDGAKKSRSREPDTSRLKYLLLALIENGAKHSLKQKCLGGRRSVGD